MISLKIAPVAAIVMKPTVFIVTVTRNLLLAVGCGTVLAGFLFMQRMIQT